MKVLVHEGSHGYQASVSVCGLVVERTAFSEPVFRLCSGDLWSSLEQFGAISKPAQASFRASVPLGEL